MRQVHPSCGALKRKGIRMKAEGLARPDTVHVSELEQDEPTTEVEPEDGNDCGACGGSGGGGKPAVCTTCGGSGQRFYRPRLSGRVRRSRYCEDDDV